MSAAAPRLAWVDYAKGLCIILVVLMHATLGAEKAAGSVSWLHGFIDWARPFRMPDFFLISGLFLASQIDRPWRVFLDKKLIHFGYFYLLWMSIQVLARSYGLAQTGGLSGVAQTWLLGLAEPFGTLWFIYMLAVFFIAAKLARPLPQALILGVGAALQMAQIETGWLVIDEFASRFVYFYSGFALAPLIFAFADKVAATSPARVGAALAAWAAANGAIVAAGVSQWPGISLILGYVGAAAVVAIGVLLAGARLAAPLRYCGRNSIIIYLAFSLFMAGARSLLLLQVDDSVSAVALLSTCAGLVGPLLLAGVARRLGMTFLFQRPAWARLRPANVTPSAFAMRLAHLSKG